MKRITIGRYQHQQGELPDEGVTAVADVFAGWIEGVRDDGTTWIMWLDAAGSPEQFWGRRDEDGGIEGEPVDLSPAVAI